MDEIITQQRGKYERIRICAAQGLLTITLLLGLLTTFSAAWIIYRLDLNQNIQSIRRDIGLDGKHFTVISQDVVVDELRPREKLMTKKLSGEYISISSSYGPSNDSIGLFLNSDTTRLIAKSFTNPSGRKYHFNLPSSINKLAILSGAYNVRSVRGLHPNSRTKAESSTYDLNIQSDDKLELSGNLGLRANGKSMHINSRDQISMTSRDGSVLISSASGLYINLKHKSNYESVGDIQQICISRDNGQLFAGSC